MTAKGKIAQYRVGVIARDDIMDKKLELLKRYIEDLLGSKK
jgi:hypothetical protein